MSDCIISAGVEKIRGVRFRWQYSYPHSPRHTNPSFPKANVGSCALEDIQCPERPRSSNARRIKRSREVTRRRESYGRVAERDVDRERVVRWSDDQSPTS